MQGKEYLMENDEEALRLDIKTDTSVVEKQALWAGIETGMRVADIGD
ncbi:MAG: methyltransferase type 11, partial [Candidatus Kuenenia stuttgartiensis]|nr:methyltransferase type 11 [Candidatus Kuenenia stuttgartiensis]